jgi:hypothetical protein
MVDITKFLPGKDNKDSQEYFWSLVIEPGWVQAGIWRIVDEKAQVVVSGSSSAWEPDSDLVAASDTALSSAIQDFPEDIGEPEKTVFGVISSWVSKGQIKDEYLDKIKKVCSELSLKPVGFVVLSEAIAHFVKSEEGSPLSAVVLGVYKQTLEISVFKLGNLAGTSEVARSVSMVDDVTEGLSRFELVDNVPSRFIVYNGKEGELEEAKQALLKANWDDIREMKFLHTPKVEVMDAKRKVHAVSLAGASELAGVDRMADKTKQEEENASLMHESEMVSGDLSTSPEVLGFVQERDIVLEQSGDKRSQTDNVLKKQPKFTDNIKPVSKKILKNKLSGTRSMIFGGLLGRMRKKLSSVSGVASGFKFGKKAFFFGIFFFILIVVLGFAWWWYYPKATVTVYVAPKSLEERMFLTVDSDTVASSVDDMLLKAEIFEGSETGDKTKSTSGTKTVGDKAQGEVAVYRVGSELSLSQGTTLFGPNDLKFSLGEQVTLASGSASAPSVSKVKVSAEEIGSQYNLASGTSFSVGNYPASELEAKSDTSFSGGSSREINAVSIRDQEILQEELAEELTEKIKSKLLVDLPEGKILVEESLVATSSSRTFSGKVGDEASSLKLTLTLDAKAVVVNKDDLMQLSQNALQDKVPDGFVLRKEQIEVEFKFKEREDGRYLFEAKVLANLLPKIDVVEVATTIKGKYPKLARDYFVEELPGFVRAEIKIRPSLPGRLATLPRVAKNIEVIVAAEK